MNNAVAMSLRARINNLAKRTGVSPQLALQSYFTERLLARIEKSSYAKHIAIKGGTLMCSLLGIAERTTMDVDATLFGMKGSEEIVLRMLGEIAKIDLGDGVIFRRDETAQTKINKDDEYGGWSVGLIAELGTIRLPLGVDITYGDIITPAPEIREFKGVLDDTLRIHLLAYTVETLIAEKLQSILKRGPSTTRLRDFYDLHKLHRCEAYSKENLAIAIRNTLANRHSEKYLHDWQTIVAAIENSPFQREQWKRYQRKMPYASGIAFDELLASIKAIFAELQLTDQTAAT